MIGECQIIIICYALDYTLSSDKVPLFYESVLYFRCVGIQTYAT